MTCKRAKIFYLLFFILLNSIWIGCSKDSDPIPEVDVNLHLNLNLPSYFELSIPGGSMHVNGGSKGIIVYRISEMDFAAFDRHSPHRSTEDCSIASIDSTGITASERCDGSIFTLESGLVQSGPSKYPLKRYNTIFNDPVLQITN